MERRPEDLGEEKVGIDAEGRERQRRMRHGDKLRGLVLPSLIAVLSIPRSSYSEPVLPDVSLIDDMKATIPRQAGRRRKD